MKSTQLIQCVLRMSLLCCVLFVLPSTAADFHYSGFASLYAGKVLDGESSDYFETVVGEDSCPCFISNYYDGSYYTDEGWQFDKDTNYGVQGGVSWESGFSLVAQIEGLGGHNFVPEVTWLYARYQFNESMSLDLGRKGIPLFYYSDFLNVGYARPWVRAPGEVYGWGLNSYNGISFSYDDRLLGGDFHAGIWLGNAKDDDSEGYNTLYYHGDELLLEWSEMIGGYIEQDYNGLLFRAVLMTNKSTAITEYSGQEIVFEDDDRQRFYGLAFIYDRDNFLFQSEYNRFESPGFSSNGYYLTAGYRLGKWLPVFTYSRYKDNNDTGSILRQRDLGFTVRWDVVSMIALKAQYNYFMDDSDYPLPDSNYVGDSQLFTIGADIIF